MTDTLDTWSADYVRAVAERPAGILPGALVGTYLHGSAVLGVSAAARYLSGSSFKGKVALTGLGTLNQMRKFVKDGTVESFELWDPGKLGYLAAYAAAALASGQITGSRARPSRPGTSAPRRSAPTGRSSSARAAARGGLPPTMISGGTRGSR